MPLTRSHKPQDARSLFAVSTWHPTRRTRLGIGVDGEANSFKDGERKLYLLIEGRTETSINQTIQMIGRIVKEEITAQVRFCGVLFLCSRDQETTFNAAARLLNPGKYKVLALTN